MTSIDRRKSNEVQLRREDTFNSFPSIRPAVQIDAQAAHRFSFFFDLNEAQGANAFERLESFHNGQRNSSNSDDFIGLVVHRWLYACLLDFLPEARVSSTRASSHPSPIPIRSIRMYHACSFKLNASWEFRFLLVSALACVHSAHMGHRHVVCVTLRSLFQFFFVSSFFLTCSVALHYYLCISTVFKHKRINENTERTQTMVLCTISVFLSALSVAIILFNGGFVLNSQVGAFTHSVHTRTAFTHAQRSHTHSIHTRTAFTHAQR
jgi:hypothetical protein